MEELKKCKDCQEFKENSEFYKSQGECKECTKLRVRKREILRSLDPEWVEKERSRHREKYHRLSYKDKHKPSPEAKKLTVDKYKNKCPEKRKAVLASMNIETPKGFEKHHWSYQVKYHKDVLFLNTRDHNQLHRFLTYDSSKFIYTCKVMVGDFKVGDPLDTKERHLSYYVALKTSLLWE